MIARDENLLKTILIEKYGRVNELGHTVCLKSSSILWAYFVVSYGLFVSYFEVTFPSFSNLKL